MSDGGELAALSAAQVEAFDRDGYLVIEGALGADAIASMKYVGTGRRAVRTLPKARSWRWLPVLIGCA